jgi:hypothetical protein
LSAGRVDFCQVGCGEGSVPDLGTA